VDARLLGIYLNDHLAGAVAGREVAKRCLENNEEGPLGDFLRVLVREIEEDRASLMSVMSRLDLGVSPIKMGAAWAGEKLGRLKLNGRLVGYSPLSRVEELEFLALGVRGKLLMWQVLDALSAADGDERLEGFDFARLMSRAEAQLEELGRYRLEAAVQSLGS
jgi:hypothetical protein